MAASAIITMRSSASSSNQAAAPAAERSNGVVGVQGPLVDRRHFADPTPSILRRNRNNPVEMERGLSAGSTCSSTCTNDEKISPTGDGGRKVHFLELLGPIKKFLGRSPSNNGHARNSSNDPVAATPGNGTAPAAQHQAAAAFARPVAIRANTAPVNNSTPCTLKEKYGKPCQLLGKGANGNCWLVRRHTDQKVFAVKEFRRRRENESQRQYMKKLTNEYCIGSLLHHPNVVETLDIIFEKGHCYEVMELCEGGDLFEAISSHTMTTEESNCIFAQLMQGVAYLHSIGVCHRDLKPENCLFDSNNHLKIIDFGSADVVKSPFETECRRSTGRCGSGPYMAPEEFTQPSYDGRKVDVWACAIIYLAMMFQRFPWHSAKASDEHYAAYVENGGHSKFFDRLPDGPRQILSRMLDPNPDLRATIEDCLEDEWVRSIVVCDECVTRHQHGRVARNGVKMK
ncbi:hypothetical protein SpCBS45565_g06308 [Spizellomyces sp. 'palustris']|nr:hypothetical protein SpCBS45565_g06308 [Spizellomyces sp. 'palustris']